MRAGTAALLVVTLAACTQQPRPHAAGATAGPDSVTTRSKAMTNWGHAQTRVKAAAATACSPVTPGNLYRFLAGIDQCMQPMPAGDQTALNDPYGVMLRKNQGGAGPWPSTVSGVVSAVATIPNIQAPTSYVIGEGSQVPPAVVTSPTGNRNLRYVVTWLTTGTTPVLYLSSRPDSTLPIFLQVIGWDPVKQAFNYYQYISNHDLSGDPDDEQTWSYAGDSSNAQAPATTGQGCFACHRNGALNMKELQVPWNNWNSQAVSIPPANVPPAMTTDLLFVNASGAEQLQAAVFQPVMSEFMTAMVSSSISGGTVSNAGALLRHLITNTTINFRSSQVQSRPAAFPPLNLPNTFVLNDELLGSTGVGLSYTVPSLSVPASTYNTLVTSRNYYLINTDINSRPPTYKWPGDNFFSFFYPEPAFEDVVAATQLWQQNVISRQFAAAVLMVDYPNPVFSPVRDQLLQYSSQLTTGKTDGKDVPSQFAALVEKAAASQPKCTSTDLTKCTAEQQFVAYWAAAQLPNWQTTFVNILNPYLSAVGQRIATQQGVADYMTLTTGRQEQFQNYPGVCNLYEFDLFLPCNSAGGGTFYSMNSDGTISPQPAYTCPTRSNWTNPCLLDPQPSSEF